MTTCQCGCGRPFDGPPKKRFFSAACYYADRNRKAKAARAATLPLLTKTCACGCGRSFETRKPSRRFFTLQCSKNHWGRTPKTEREARRSAKKDRHPNTALIHAAKADTPPGECIYCENRVKARAVICREPECLTSYHRDYGQARRAREKEARGRKEVVCACGCGERFFQEKGRIYLNPTHWAKTRRKKRAARRPVMGPHPHGPGITFGKRTEPRDVLPYPLNWVRLASGFQRG